ncbi:MAG: penicillin-binding protein, partial [Deltaproteobacteria bacterium]|nr:penicillin-binding protein [Deltaproteobacteria bacterium]
MKAKDTWVRRRVFMGVGLFVFLFGVVFARAFKMQVIDSEYLKKKADSQHTATIKIAPKRGNIYDRNLGELAVSVDTYSIGAHPNMLDSPRKAALELAVLVDGKTNEVEKKLSTGKNFVWVKRQIELTEDNRRKLARLKWAVAVKEPKRFYPNQELAANMV